jgi:2-dehydro-3-deoxygluconokinase
VMIGNEEDFTAALGFGVDHVDEHLRDLPIDSFAAMVDTVAEKMPWLSVVATTLRTVHTASDNDWQAIAWSPDTGVLSSVARKHLAIFDRVGGGDGFASGLIYGLLQGEELQQCLELGAAHGALAMTTPGDTSMASREEVIALAAGGSARVRR